MNENSQIQWNDLLKEAQAGDQEAKNHLCRELEVRLRPVLQYRLWRKASEDLEDILQDTLMIMMEKIDQIKSNPHKYVFQILRNKIGDTLRKQHQHREIPIQPGAEEDADRHAHVVEETLSTTRIGEDFSSDMETADMVDHIRIAIKKLSVFCRTFFLAVLEERTIQELWELFKELEPDLQRSTFDKRIFDCRRRLRELVKNHM